MFGDRRMNIVVGALLAAGSLAGPGMAAETFRVQTSFNAGNFAIVHLTEQWAPKLTEMTGGELSIELLPADTVVPYRETPEAVAAGVLDGDLTAIGYFSGRDAAFALIGDLIGGYDKPSQIMGFCREGGGEGVLQAAFESFLPGKIHVVGCSPYNREAMVATVPIRGLEDLKGVKVRAPEGLPSEVFLRAGATPVTLPQSELYSALERGIVEAADASAYANNDAIGLHDIAKYPIYPGIHSMATSQFTLNQDKWAALSPEHQTTLQEWFYLAMSDLTEAVDTEDKKLVERDKAAGEIEVVDWPQADRDGLRAIAKEAWTAFASKSTLGKQALDAHLAYMKSIGLLTE